jgi:hypothetical protein
MTQSLIADPAPLEIERPPCPKCHGPMTFAGLSFRKDGVEIRTFECMLCNRTDKVTVK